jgi:hypothetical protein
MPKKKQEFKIIYLVNCEDKKDEWEFSCERFADARKKAKAERDEWLAEHGVTKENIHDYFDEDELPFRGTAKAGLYWQLLDHPDLPDFWVNVKQIRHYL